MKTSTTEVYAAMICNLYRAREALINAKRKTSQARALMNAGWLVHTAQIVIDSLDSADVNPELVKVYADRRAEVKGILNDIRIDSEKPLSKFLRFFHL